MKAVDKRAGVLTEEYRKKAKNVDRVYGGVAEGAVGRVQRKLEEFGEVRGLVFGAFWEASEGVHELVHVLANSRLKAVGLQQGRQTGSGELGVLVGQIRRILSVTAVRGQAECLLSRLRNVGRGTGVAYRRRDGSSEGGGELGKGEAGADCGQEAGEEGGEAWNVPPGLGGGET